MAIYQAVGTGPVSFLNSFQSQCDLPLNQVFFTANGVDFTASPYLVSDGTVLTGLLSQLVAQGLLIPGSNALSATSPPLIAITASQAGAAGNSILVDFSNPIAATGLITVTVSATQSYTGLTTANAETSVGNSATSAGYVYVEDPGPATAMPLAAGFSQTIIPPGKPLLIPDASSDAKGLFTVVPTNNATVAALANWQLEISIPAPASGATTFSMNVTWTQTIANVTLASLLSTNPFAPFVSFSGQGGPLPAAGTVALSGGADAIPAAGTSPTVAAVPATANLYASS